MSEHELQTQIVELIRKRGGVATRVNSGGSVSKRGGYIRLADKGTADIIACFRGHYIAPEVKFGKNEPSDDQKDFFRRVREAGGISFPVWNIEQMNHELDLLERGEQ